MGQCPVATTGTDECDSPAVTGWLISTKAPAGTAGKVDLTVRTGDVVLGGQTPTSDDYTYIAPAPANTPAVTRVSGGPVIAVVTEGDSEATELSDDVIRVPAVADFLQPIVAVVPLQLLAYHTAILRGCDVDKPRNLAKSVTVE